MEEILQNSLEKHQYFLENIILHVPHFIFWKDTSSVYIGCNKNYARLIGYNSPSEIVGKTDYDLGWRSDGHTAEFFRSRDQEALAGKFITNLEQTLSLKNGKKIIVLLDKVPLFDEEGNVVAILAVATDITELKETERELIKAKKESEAANIAKTSFIANMTHDLRTLLNGIIGCTQVLQQKLKKPENLEFVNGIYNSGKLLLNLIESVLDFSKYESGELVYVNEPLNIQVITQEVVAALQDQAQQKNIKLSAEFIGNIPDFVIGDCNYIRRILVNLLGNSIKFTNQGAVDLKIICKKMDDKHAHFEFIIQDTGIGMPEDKLDTIFDRFTRLDPSYNSRYPGTGLGLAIVKQAIEQMKGEIHVTSKLGEGTKFVCQIPFKLPSENKLISS